jgi:hypothetical protein
MLRPLRPSAAPALLGLTLLLLLGGCLSRGDALAPIVSISEPRNGAVQSAENLRVRGYAMDDEGVVAIRVNGSDLLDSDFLAGERGKQLINFEFTFQNLREGESTSIIEVVDSSGRTSVLTFTLQIDVTPPTLELTSVTPIGDGRLRVQGVARDDTGVLIIRINELPLTFTPSLEHTFEIDVEAIEGGSVVVEDSAGNRTVRALQ